MRIETARVDVMELYNPPPGIVIRAGIIPFIVKDHIRYYLLGSLSDQKITDMGGGCKTSRNERPIDCLKREINEETDIATGKEIISYLESMYPPRGNYEIEVWRQRAERFEDFGYPFPQKKGPIYRYYILLEIDDPLMKLGGYTWKNEVSLYRYISEEELVAYSSDQINRSCQDFFNHRWKKRDTRT